MCVPSKNEDICLQKYLPVSLLCSMTTPVFHSCSMSQNYVMNDLIYYTYITYAKHLNFNTKVTEFT